MTSVGSPPNTTRDSSHQAPSFRPHHLLVANESLGAVARRLTELGAPFRRHAIGRTGVTRLVLDPAVRLPAPPELARLLRAAEPAARVAPNRVLRLASHLHAVGASSPQPAGPLAPLPTGDDLPGHEVVVAVVDSGFCDDAWFGGQVEFREGQDEEAPPADSDTLPFATGHGTFVAGVVLQHAPGARVVARRVVDDHGHVDDETLGRALEGLEDGVDIVNLSLGGTVDDTEDAFDLLVTANSLMNLWERNPDLVVVAPSGNLGAEDTDFWPARFDRVIAVAALGADGRPASFSNSGPWVNACAVGENVHSRFLTWDGKVEVPPPNDQHRYRSAASAPFQGWATWSGTSFAAARVSGVIAAATRKADGVLAPQAAQQLLREDAGTFPGFGTVVR